MRLDRFMALEEIFRMGKYKIDIHNGIIYKQDGTTPMGSKNKKGYLTVVFIYENRRWHYRAHEVIACYGGLLMAEYLTVNHKDGNKLNNKISNLETITSAENTRHAFKSGLAKSPCNIGMRNGSAKITDDLVRKIRAEYVPGKNTVRQLGEKYRLSHTSIVRIINHEQWKHIV